MTDSLPPKQPDSPEAPSEDSSEDSGQYLFDASNPNERFNVIQQGETAELAELAPDLKHVRLGVGWELIGFDESMADLDASLFLLNKDDLTREDGDFIFYGNTSALDGAVEHTGDSRTGAGSGDDEQIFIDLTKIPFDVIKIMVVLTIHDPHNKDYSFDNVRNVYMRIEDKDTDREIFRYFLDKELKQTLEDNHLVSGLYIGYFERNANEWIFHAQGEVEAGGLGRIATRYGMVVVGA